MGETRSARGLSDAAGGRPAGRLAARSHLSRFWRDGFWKDESGATAIEYGLIASLVFLVIVTAVTTFGNKTTTIMETVSTAIGKAIGG